MRIFEVHLLYIPNANVPYDTVNFNVFVFIEMYFKSQITVNRCRNKNHINSIIALTLYNKDATRLFSVNCMGPISVNTNKLCNNSRISGYTTTTDILIDRYRLLFV